MLKHTKKKQAYLSEKQFVSNLKIRGIILSLVKTPTMGRNAFKPEPPFSGDSMNTFKKQ